MKKFILFMSLGLSLLTACNARREKMEDEPYNPFDTSEQMEDDSMDVTIYNSDSLNLPANPSQKADQN